MIALRLFGALALEVDGRDTPPPQRLHGRLVLAYLALHPGAHARADLAALLWPGSSPDSARSNLRSAVASLRRAVGEGHVLARRDSVMLADAWVDALEFRELLRRGRLEEALRLAGEPLLQGLEASWVELERGEHHELAEQALEVLALQAEDAGDLRVAVGHARRRVALDPLAEPRSESSSVCCWRPAIAPLRWLRTRG